MEGVKPHQIHKSRDHRAQFVGGVAFLVKNDLFDPCDPYVTFDPKLSIRHSLPKVAVTLTKFGQNLPWHVEVISMLTERKKERTRLSCVIAMTHTLPLFGPK